MWFLKMWKYLNKQDQRPLLVRGYTRAGETRTPTWEESQLIAYRLARTPDQARRLLDQYGTVPAVLTAVKPPERKPPPRWQRFKRVIRRMFP